jgi:pyrroline-5-carboxylate reductase
MRIAFIGGGNMGEAMIRCLIEKGVAKAADIVASDVIEARRSYLKKQHGIATASINHSAAEKADVIILAVKPNVMTEALADLKGRTRADQTVISIAAGVALSKLCQGLDRQSVVRAMPNTPAQIGEGMTVWTVAGEATELDKERARIILGAMGKQVFVADEKFIDMATAVSGSGPGYVFLIIESLVDAAVRIGLPRDMALELVMETISGSVHLAQKSGRHPAELRNMVTSPGGTTAEGLHELEEGRLRALLARAIIAGYEKAKALRGD